MSQTSAPLPHFQILATLHYYQPSVPLPALIYLGANDSFLDMELAAQSGLAIEPFDPPISPNALDEKLLAQVNHRKHTLLLVLLGNHCEQVWLNLISSSCTPLVLAYSWLSKHNPHIDWLTGRTTNWC